MTLPAGMRLGAYEILAPIGAGGMGEVYRGRDLRLDREVAIKVLPESVAADPSALERFEREARAIASLSHQNILAIHDFGSQDGVSYAVMELLEGRTLRETLFAGALPRDWALDYAAQIARGLTAAHEKGIVHRDLKPENVFVTKQGLVKILDFGLAKRVRSAPPEVTSAPTDSAFTEPGTVMGTAGYMSPEQVRGQPVDQRSDIFSFGAILYEMLSGRRAFRGATPADTMSAILKEQPPALSGSQGRISAGLDRVVRHCLEKDRDRRFQTARDVEFALAESNSASVTGRSAGSPSSVRMSMPWIASATLAVLVLSLFLLRRSHDSPPAAPPVQRVAVLPFENLGAPEDDYFVDGIADEIRSRLTSLSGIEVVARTSSVVYRKTSKTPAQIGKELSARYLLMATVRWQKNGVTNRVHVTPELVELTDAGVPTSKWQQPYDAALTDVFQVQADVATRVARALGVALAAKEKERFGERPTQSLTAYEFFLKGQEAFRSDRIGGFQQAIAAYEQAVALDPTFALAWSALSFACSWSYIDNPSRELSERAHTAASRAMALDPTRPETYLALGSYEALVLREFAPAIGLLEKGRRLAPHDSDLLVALGGAEVNDARWRVGVEHYREAERVDPLSTDPPVFLGGALLRLHRYPEALAVIDRGLTISPTDLPLVGFKTVWFVMRGDLDGARTFLKSLSPEMSPTSLVPFLASFWDLVFVLDEQQRDLLLRLTPGAFEDNRATWGLCIAQGYALMADIGHARIFAERAREASEAQIRDSPRKPWLHSNLGLALAFLGRKEEAIREAKKAILLEPAKDGWVGPSLREALARIYLLTGEPERALDEIEGLQKLSSSLTPGWLKVDPRFDALRRNSRFQKLISQSK